MQTTRSGQDLGTAHMIERQMLLHYARSRADNEASCVKTACKFRFITISRDKGSRGDEIAQMIADYLGWRVFDKEIVDYISRNSHVRQALVEQLDEKDQNLIHESVQRLLRMAEGGSFGVDEYHEALSKTLAFLASKGEAVIVGRGANFVLRDDPGLHVRIISSPEVRAERLALRWHVSVEEATLRMQELDAERRNFIRRHFKRDPNDPRWYDLVFNTDHLTAQQVSNAILAVAGFPRPADLNAGEATISSTAHSVSSDMAKMGLEKML